MRDSKNKHCTVSGCMRSRVELQTDGLKSGGGEGRGGCLVISCSVRSMGKL